MQDLRLGIRALRATPVVTAVAVLSLALGIGANTAIFAVVNSLLLRTLPVLEPQRLAIVSTTASRSDRPQYSYATFEQIRQHGHFIDGALAYTTCCGTSIVTLGGENRLIDRQWVSGDFFATLGLKAFRGRLFTPSDDEPQPTGGAVAVVSFPLWKRWFGARDDIIGAQLTIDQTTVTVVGVTPPEFFGVEVGRTVDLMLPGVRSSESSSPLLARNVAATLTAINPAIAFTFQPLAEQIEESLAQDRLIAILSAFFGLLALLLAGLGLYGVTAYAVARRRGEISIRMALGATPGGVLRLVLSRVSALVGIGVGIGAATSLWASTFVASLMYGLEPRDPMTLIGSALVLAAVGLFAGWLPACRASRIDPARVLRES